MRIIFPLSRLFRLQALHGKDNLNYFYMQCAKSDLSCSFYILR